MILGHRRQAGTDSTSVQLGSPSPNVLATRFMLLALVTWVLPEHQVDQVCGNDSKLVSKTGTTHTSSRPSTYPFAGLFFSRLALRSSRFSCIFFP